MQQTDLASWVKEARAKKGMSQKQLSELVGIPQSTIAAWETQRGRPSFDDVIAVAKATGMAPPTSYQFGAEEENGDLVTISSVDHIMFGKTTVTETIHSAKVPLDWIRATYPALVSTASLGLLTSHGDSMTPTFNSGDVLLVDMAVNAFEADAIYAFLYLGNFFVKRLMRKLDGGAMVISDNKNDYPTQELTRDQLNDVEIKARILGTWKWTQL